MSNVFGRVTKSQTRNNVERKEDPNGQKCAKIRKQNPEIPEEVGTYSLSHCRNAPKEFP